MKLLSVHPMYGYGWYDSRMNAFEVPPAFELQGLDMGGGQFSGIVQTGGHSLAGFRVELTRRTAGEVATYNLRAFDQADPQAAITGFCSLAGEV